MKVTLDIADSEFIRQVTQEINKKVDILYREKIKKIDLNKIIENRVNYLISQSQYVSDHIIRNLVQQKIAREIANKIIKSDENN